MSNIYLIRNMEVEHEGEGLMSAVITANDEIQAVEIFKNASIDRHGFQDFNKFNYLNVKKVNVEVVGMVLENWIFH